MAKHVVSVSSHMLYTYKCVVFLVLCDKLWIRIIKHEWGICVSSENGVRAGDIRRVIEQRAAAAAARTNLSTVCSMLG